MTLTDAEQIISQQEARQILDEHSILLDPMDRRNAQQYVGEMLTYIAAMLDEEALDYEIERHETEPVVVVEVEPEVIAVPTIKNRRGYTYLVV